MAPLQPSPLLAQPVIDMGPRTCLVVNQGHHIPLASDDHGRAQEFVAQSLQSSFVGGETVRGLRWNGDPPQGLLQGAVPEIEFDIHPRFDIPHVLNATSSPAQPLSHPFSQAILQL